MNNFLRSDSCVFLENKLFFVTNNGNFLMYLDINKGEVHFQDMVCLPERIEYMTVCNNIIYAFGLDGKWAYAIDYKKSVYHSIYINGQGKTWGNYRLIEARGEKVIIIPSALNYMIEIDTKSYEKEKLEFDFEIDQYEMVRKIDSDLLFFSSKEQKYIKYDLSTNQYFLCKIESKIGYVCRIHINKKSAFLINRYGEIYRLNISNNKSSYIGKIDASILKKIEYFIVANNKVVLLPGIGKDIYIYDIEKKFFQIYEQYPSDYEISCPSKWGKYTKYFEDELNFYFSNRCSEYFLLIDKKTGYFNWVRSQNLEYSNWIKILSKKMAAFYSEADMSLKVYLDCIKNCKTEER